MSGPGLSSRALRHAVEVLVDAIVAEVAATVSRLPRAQPEPAPPRPAAAPAAEPELLNPAQAAARLGLSRVALLKRLRQGAIPAEVAVRISERSIRFRAAALDTWIASMREGQPRTFDEVAEGRARKEAAAAFSALARREGRA